MTKIAIIGAGLSGLSLARAMPRHAEISLFEKSRGIGGRMATRYTDAYEFDHGAQFFTAKTDAFSRTVKDYQITEQVRTWPVTIEAFGGAHETNAEKFIANPRMNALCKAMADGLDVRRHTQITKIDRVGEDWHLQDSDGELHGPFDWVISSAPAPQASALLPDIFSSHTQLASVRMEGCFALMIGFESLVTLPWPGARIAGSPVGWMTVNSDKPGRSNASGTSTSIIIQSTNAWAEVNLEEPHDKVEATLLAAASQISGVDLGNAAHTALHRWRYAATPGPAGADFLLDQENQLAACGDWCLGSRVEAAFTSGHKLGEKLSELV